MWQLGALNLKPNTDMARACVKTLMGKNRTNYGRMRKAEPHGQGRTGVVDLSKRVGTVIGLRLWR